MLNSKYDDAYGLREIYRIQGIKLGYGRAVAIMRPPARINTAPRPNECGRPPESIVNYLKYFRFFAHPIHYVGKNSEHP